MVLLIAFCIFQVVKKLFFVLLFPKISFKVTKINYLNARKKKMAMFFVIMFKNFFHSFLVVFISFRVYQLSMFTKKNNIDILDIDVHPSKKQVKLHKIKISSRTLCMRFLNVTNQSKILLEIKIFYIFTLRC